MGVIGTRFTDVFSVTDSLGQPGPWKAFGTIVIQLPRNNIFDRIEKLVVRLSASASDSAYPLKLDVVTLTATYSAVDFNQSWSTTTSMDEFLRVGVPSFTEAIGKFYRNEFGYIEYANIVAGETTQSPALALPVPVIPSQLPVGTPDYAAMPNLKQSITVVRNFNCDFSDLCTPVDCDVCMKWTPLTPITNLQPTVTFKPKSCEQIQIEHIKNDIAVQYKRLLADKEFWLRKNYTEKCDPSAIIDKVTITVPVKNYHYTLYYYDRVGNLVKTVPPKGVVTSSSYTRASSHPLHTFVTEYEYTSLGQLKRHKTPDGGDTRYWYNNKGQLRFSQNAKQQPDNKFSYTIYDHLGRVKESGEITDALAPNNVNTATYPTSSSRNQVTTIVYTTPESTLSLGQRNTLNRVSYAKYEGDLTAADDNSATYYSYDAHGNVEWTVQQIADLDLSGPGLSKINYLYDLASGNVKEVQYQDGKADRFYHKYEYDKDNRLVAVLTSRDRRIWDRDAQYEFYQHGPLRRTVTGEDFIQGTDYTYTLHGWLKGINHPSLDPAVDPGADGGSSYSGASPTGKDAFGMTLGYFSGDFNRSNSAGTLHSAFNTVGTVRPDTMMSKYQLFNGNIASWSSNIKPPTGVTTGKQFENLTGSFYRYDMLNRLRNDNFRDWAGSAWSTTENQYSSSYSYDANGNIKNIKRKAIDGGTVKQIDDLQFTYPNETTDNKLGHVTDPQGEIVAGFTDIKDGQSSGNYDYYPDGSLKKDTQEGITSIEWTVTGKVKRIIKQDGTTIYYYYNATGQRVKKIVAGSPVSPNLKTYYVYDAGGTLMATYEHNYLNYTADIELKEWPINGAGRVGLALPPSTIKRTDANPSTSQTIFTRYVGKKRYEFTDHLGNVRAVISDVKLPDGSNSFTADLVSYSNYYPFGMEQPNRTWSVSSAEEFRYGYNGMEKDEAVAGQPSNIYTTEFRMYDPRLGGRWWSQDPVVKSWESPYAGMANNPIYYSDPSGLNPGDGNAAKGSAEGEEKETAFQKSFRENFGPDLRGRTGSNQNQTQSNPDPSFNFNFMGQRFLSDFDYQKEHEKRRGQDNLQSQVKGLELAGKTLTGAAIEVTRIIEYYKTLQIQEFRNYKSEEELTKFYTGLKRGDRRLAQYSSQLNKFRALQDKINFWSKFGNAFVHISFANDIAKGYVTGKPEVFIHGLFNWGISLYTGARKMTAVGLAITVADLYLGDSFEAVVADILHSGDGSGILYEGSNPDFPAISTGIIYHLPRNK